MGGELGVRGKGGRMGGRRHAFHLEQVLHIALFRVGTRLEAGHGVGDALRRLRGGRDRHGAAGGNRKVGGGGRQ